MKALTISQPYASLSASGEKWIENRSWQTLYRGPLAIHAGQGTQYLTRRQLQKYPSGILAVCDLAACFQAIDVEHLGGQLATVGLTVREVMEHKHMEGPWCWLLQNVRPLREPIPCSGERGLWDWLAPEALDLLDTGDGVW